MTGEAKPVTFPYKDMAAAMKDEFKKIGGPEKAFAFLVKGYKNALWRKRTDAKTKERERAEDAEFELSSAKETGTAHPVPRR